MRNSSLHSGDRITALHIDDVDTANAAQYRFAADYLSKKDYRFGLDLFCGSGYGTLILAEKLPSIIMGIDGSGEAIMEATRRIGLANVLFAQKVFPFSLPKQWANFIVSFQSVSHLEHSEAFMHLLSSTLAPSGTLVFSAYNEDSLPLCETVIQLPWHIRHFRPNEIKTLFESFGLKQKYAVSVDTCTHANGRIVRKNKFSAANTTLRPDAKGNVVVYIFEKAT